MITREEIIRGRPATATQLASIDDLVVKLNVIRAAWGKPMVITSGLRLSSDQARINPKATRSAHLEGMAADVSDPKGELYQFLQDRPQLLVEANLYCELGTKGWVHLQTRPTKRRWFNP